MRRHSRLSTLSRKCFDVVWGELEANRWELAFAAQRIEWDAVLGAFNSDDWWFHSWARGQLASLAINFTPRLDGRLSVFSERRDDRSRHVERFLLDFTWRIGPG